MSILYTYGMYISNIHIFWLYYYNIVYLIKVIVKVLYWVSIMKLLKMVKNIFITIRYKDLKDIGLHTACSKLLAIDKYAMILGVQEKHRNQSYHYHIIMILKVGLSKHTYRNKIRNIYPDLRGHGIHIEGIRRMVKTGKYLLKEVNSLNDAVVINTQLQDFVFKYIKNKEMYAYFSILSCRGTLDDWLKESLENRDMYFKNSKKVRTIWDYTSKNKIRSMKSLKHSIINSEVDFTSPIKHIDNDIPFAQCVLLIKFCMSLFIEPQWKRTNILITGSPNVGKTSLLKKFEIIYKSQMYWAPARIGDIRGFDPNHGIIVLDDVIRSSHKWPLAILLKMLGSEGFKGDAKIKDIVDVPVGIPVIIITNYGYLFLEHESLKQRLFHIHLTEKFSWVDLDEQQFMAIIRLTIAGVSNITASEQKYWNYIHDYSKLDMNHVGIVRQLQLAINSILTRRGNTQVEFPKDIYNTRESGKELPPID